MDGLIAGRSSQFYGDLKVQSCKFPNIT